MSTITTLPNITKITHITSYDVYLWCNNQSQYSYRDIITALKHKTLTDIDILYDVFTWATHIRDEHVQLQLLSDVFNFPHMKTLSIVKKYVLIAPLYAHAMNTAHLQLLSWCYQHIEFFLNHPTVTQVTKMYYRFTFGNTNPTIITDKQCKNQLDTFFNYGGEILPEDVYTALNHSNLKLASLLIKTFTFYKIRLNTDKITHLLANPKLNYNSLEKKRAQTLVAKHLSTL